MRDQVFASFEIGLQAGNFSDLLLGHFGLDEGARGPKDREPDPLLSGEVLKTIRISWRALPPMLRQRAQIRA